MSKNFPLPKPDTRSALLDGILETLRGNEMRITKPRIKMLQCLLVAPRPLSIEELRIRADPSGESLIYSTVYRFLQELERLKLVQRVYLSPSTSHFELSPPDHHHDHLICNSCGVVTVIEEPCPVMHLEQQIATRYGFTEVSHSLQFHGLCPSCRPEGTPSV